MLTNSAASTAFSSKRRYSNPDRSTSAPPGRFLVLLLFWLLALRSPLLPAETPLFPDIPDQESCKTSHHDERVSVRQVIDGDTVILADNRHVRLIGINTPEIGREGKASELGAEPARDYLSRLLQTQKVVRLRYDQEHKDHYGRTLAHLFLDDGTNIQSLLLHRGLAITLIIPPNLDFIDCYQTNAGFARSQKIGLWALKQYQPIPAVTVSRDDLGYRIISGTVLRVGNSRSAVWLNLANHVALRITRENLPYFDPIPIQDLTGREMTARGWLYYANGQYRMQIHHPLDVEIQEQPARN